jgi:hypothetical protein
MKNNYKEKITSFFKENPDQVVIIIILILIILGAIYASYQFYLALYPQPVTLGELDYKEIKLRIKDDVLEELNQRREIDKSIQKNINEINDPFK